MEPSWTFIKKAVSWQWRMSPSREKRAQGQQITGAKSKEAPEPALGLQAFLPCFMVKPCLLIILHIFKIKILATINNNITILTETGLFNVGIMFFYIG